MDTSHSRKPRISSQYKEWRGEASQGNTNQLSTIINTRMKRNIRMHLKNARMK